MAVRNEDVENRRDNVRHIDPGEFQLGTLFDRFVAVRAETVEGVFIE